MLLQSALTPSLIGAGQPQFRTWLHDSLKRLTKRLYWIETLTGRHVIVMNSPGRSTLRGVMGGPSRRRGLSAIIDGRPAR